MATLVVPSNGNGGAPSAPRYNYRFWERLQSEELREIRGSLDAVLDDRSRQYDLFGGAPSAPLTPATKEIINHDLAEVLSPSQVRTYLQCSAKWYFRYFRDLPDVSTGGRALGRAVHRAIELWARCLIAGATPSAEDVDTAFRVSLESELHEAELRDDEDAAELQATGAGLVGVFLRDAAPRLKPAATELACAGEIGGVKVRGYIDILDASGAVVDVKTSSRRPGPAPEPDHLLQLSTYSLLTPRASGASKLITLTKTKTPACYTAEHAIGEADVQLARSLYPLAQEGMRAGVYIPNRGSMMCSRKYCAYWRACEREFGGEVGL